MKCSITDTTNDIASEHIDFRGAAVITNLYIHCPGPEVLLRNVLSKMHKRTMVEVSL